MWDGPHRLARCLAALRGLEGELADEQLARGERPRVVVERLPWHFASRAGSQVRTVYGASGVAHVIAAWGCRQEWEYPWLIPPSRETRRGGDPADAAPGWRDWWELRGKRPELKRAAVRIVGAMGWGEHLDGLRAPDAKGDGAAGDVAEAILLGVGACRHETEAPTSPREWR